MSDSNPPSGSPEPVSSPMSYLTCLQSSPTRLSLWTVLILSTFWVAVLVRPEAHDKHCFPSLLGVCTSGKSCRGFVPLHAVVYLLRKREMRPGRTQDSCRCLGSGLLRSGPGLSVLNALERNHSTLVSHLLGDRDAAVTQWQSCPITKGLQFLMSL